MTGQIKVPALLIKVAPNHRNVNWIEDKLHVYVFRIGKDGVINNSEYKSLDIFDAYAYSIWNVRVAF